MAGAGLEPESLSTETRQADTTALSVLANEELQDVPGLCSAMIHTAKLIERGP